MKILSNRCVLSNSMSNNSELRLLQQIYDTHQGMPSYGMMSLATMRHIVRSCGLPMTSFDQSVIDLIDGALPDSTLIQVTEKEIKIVEN